MFFFHNCSILPFPDTSALSDSCSWSGNCFVTFSDCIADPVDLQESFTCQCRQYYNQTSMTMCMPGTYRSTTLSITNILFLVSFVKPVKFEYFIELNSFTYFVLCLVTNTIVSLKDIIPGSQKLVRENASDVQIMLNIRHESGAVIPEHRNGENYNITIVATDGDISDNTMANNGKVLQTLLELTSSDTNLSFALEIGENINITLNLAVSVEFDICHLVEYICVYMLEAANADYLEKDNTDNVDCLWAQQWMVCQPGNVLFVRVWEKN